MTRRAPKGRPLDGILLLDKPKGLSSNAALQEVKRLFQARKAGHTGSLDPLASGLLPICFGEATKVSSFLLDADKRYWVRARLGVQTTTGDAEGEILRTAGTGELTRERVLGALQRFTGELQQVPPMFSAVKHQGKRLYELARQGIEVVREPRSIRVYAAELLNLDADYMELDLRCSKGTYVRTLIEDIAADLGSCAHVQELRRLAVGPFRDQAMHSLDQLHEQAVKGRAALDATILSIETALAHWPSVHLDANSSFYLGQGQAVLVPQAPTQGWVCIYDQNQTLMGVGEVLDDGRVAPRRLLRSQPATDTPKTGDSSC